MRLVSCSVEPTVSGVGVLDKSVAVLDAVARGPRTLAQLVTDTGLTRATCHRLAVALEAHGLVRRDGDGRFTLGLRLIGLGRAASEAWPLAEAARPALVWLRDETGESVQLYVRHGGRRLCVDSLDSPHELRTIVDIGSLLSLHAGSAGRLLLDGAAPTGPGGWVASVEERAPGVASVSAPVRRSDGTVAAAVGVSGPIERTTRTPGVRYGEAVVEAARRIEAALSS
jgi:DNA-binding IclR family transcriptional regulator